jgi:hypothetical protein
VLELSGSDGATMQKTLIELKAGPHNFRLGGGTVNIDSIEEKADPAYTADRQSVLSRHVREFIVSYYNCILAPT